MNYKIESTPQDRLNPPLPKGFKTAPDNAYFIGGKWVRECEECGLDKPFLTDFPKSRSGCYSIICRDCLTPPLNDTVQCLRKDCDRVYQELPLTAFAIVKGKRYSYCKRCQASMRKDYKLKAANRQPTAFDCRRCQQSKNLIEYNLTTIKGKTERDLTCCDCRSIQRKTLMELINETGNN